MSSLALNRVKVTRCEIEKLPIIFPSELAILESGLCSGDYKKHSKYVWCTYFFKCTSVCTRGKLVIDTSMLECWVSNWPNNIPIRGHGGLEGT